MPGSSTSIITVPSPVSIKITAQYASNGNTHSAPAAGPNHAFLRIRPHQPPPLIAGDFAAFLFAPVRSSTVTTGNSDRFSKFGSVSTAGVVTGIGGGTATMVALLPGAPFLTY